MTHDRVGVSIKDRGQLLRFIIRKMPPLHLEGWLVRALSQIAHNPDATEADYAAAVDRLYNEGFWGLLRVRDHDLVPVLSDRLLTCCSRLLDDGTQVPCTPESLDNYVQDPIAIFALKNAALKFNMPCLPCGNASAPLGKEPNPASAYASETTSFIQ